MNRPEFTAEEASVIAEAFRVCDDENAVEATIGFIAEVLAALHERAEHFEGGMSFRAERAAKALPELVEIELQRRLAEAQPAPTCTIPSPAPPRCRPRS